MKAPTILLTIIVAYRFVLFLLARRWLTAFVAPPVRNDGFAPEEHGRVAGEGEIERVGDGESGRNDALYLPTSLSLFSLSFFLFVFFVSSWFDFLEIYQD